MLDALYAVSGGYPYFVQAYGKVTWDAADRALIAPAEREDVNFAPDALDALYAVSGGYPYFVQAYGKVTWDAAPADPIMKEDVLVAAPNADAELAVGFFGSRYERATPAERDYMRAM